MQPVCRREIAALLVSPLGRRVAGMLFMPDGRSYDLNGDGIS